MRFLLSGVATTSAPPTSNGRQGNRIQLDIVKLVVLFHLLQAAFNLLHRERDALIRDDVHDPLKRSLRV